MDKDSDVQICDNCKREVLKNNFLVHTVHCHRNIVLCAKCDSPFPKNEIEDHMKHAHQKVSCEVCGKELERHLVEEHMSEECPKRIVCCQFCEMEVKCCDQEEHENYCGSRTEQCEGCGQYVMVKFQDIHLSSNHTFFSLDDFRKPQQSIMNAIKEETMTNPSTSRPNPSKRTNDMPQVNVDREVNKEMFVKPSLQALRRSSEELSMEQLDRLIALQVAKDDAEAEGISLLRPRDEFTFPSRSLLSDFASVERTATSNRNESVAPSSEESFSLPCEFCGDLLPADVLIEHQSVCDVSLPRRDSPPSADELLPGNRSVTPEDEHLIPCEYCSELFDSQVILEHQSACQRVFREAQSVRPRTSAALPPTNAFRIPDGQADSDDELEDVMLKEAIENSLKDNVASSGVRNKTSQGSPTARQSARVRNVPIAVAADHPSRRPKPRAADDDFDPPADGSEASEWNNGLGPDRRYGGVASRPKDPATRHS